MLRQAIDGLFFIVVIIAASDRHSLEVKVTSDALQIAAPVPIDESIESFEYVQYSPAQCININSAQSVTISIESGDDNICTSKSYNPTESGDYCRR